MTSIREQILAALATTLGSTSGSKLDCANDLI